jgi:hypothetical protein
MSSGSFYVLDDVEEAPDEEDDQSPQCSEVWHQLEKAQPGTCSTEASPVEDPDDPSASSARSIDDAVHRAEDIMDYHCRRPKKSACHCQLGEDGASCLSAIPKEVVENIQ